MVFESMTQYLSSLKSVVFGRYVPGEKHPPGPQNETEYWPALSPGEIASPNPGVQSLGFQKPAYGKSAEATAVSSASR